MLDVYIVGDDMNQEISRSILNSHQPMNRQIIKIEDPYMKLDVYWIFFRAGGRDILLSKKNKHTFYELQLMLDGFICQTVEKENKIFTTTIEAGNFMIIPPNHYHQVTEASDSGTRFSVAFQIESQDTYILAAIEQIKKILVFPFPEAASSYIQPMREVFKKTSPWASKEVSNLLQCLLLQLFIAVLPDDVRGIQRDVKPDSAAGMMLEIQKYIEEHISEGISVSKVASHFGRSSRQLNRICNSQRGMPLNRIIGEEKLKYIKDLIGTSALSFTEIAELCGFSNEYALNRFFKYAEGYTLGQYRKLAMLS